MPSPAIDNALQRIDDGLASQQPGQGFSVQSLMERAKLIQEAIELRMVPGKHYGIIPGTRRVALLKPGAEALADLFHLRSIIDSKTIDLPDEHREERATCVIKYHGEDIVQRAGVCTTRETKYRYRTENTGAQVPGEYWKHGPDYKNPTLLGGVDFVPRKIDGKYLIFHQTPTPNLADQYNTVLKMAEKRAFVSAVIAALAASDALTSEDDPMYRDAQRGSRRRTGGGSQGDRGQGGASASTKPPKERTPTEPSAESTDRRIVILARLEDVAQQGEGALLSEWADLTEADRGLVGKEFGRLRDVARSVGTVPLDDDPLAE